MTELKDPLIVDTLKEDVSKSREDALDKLYARLRPGYPSDKKKALEWAKKVVEARADRTVVLIKKAIASKGKTTTTA